MKNPHGIVLFFNRSFGIFLLTEIRSNLYIIIMIKQWYAVVLFSPAQNAMNFQCKGIDAIFEAPSRSTNHAMAVEHQCILRGKNRDPASCGSRVRGPCGGIRWWICARGRRSADGGAHKRRPCDRCFLTWPSLRRMVKWGAYAQTSSTFVHQFVSTGFFTIKNGEKSIVAFVACVWNGDRRRGA